MYIEINDFFSCLKVVFSLFTERIDWKTAGRMLC